MSIWMRVTQPEPPNPDSLKSPWETYTIHRGLAQSEDTQQMLFNEGRAAHGKWLPHLTSVFQNRKIPTMLVRPKKEKKKSPPE